MARVQAVKNETLSRAIEEKDRFAGDQGVRSAGAVERLVAAAGRADEVYFWNQYTFAVFLTEQDHPWDQHVKIGGSETSGKTRVGPWVGTRTNQIDISLAVDLAAAHEKNIDAALGRAVEQFGPAVIEKAVLVRAEYHGSGFSTGARLGKQSGGTGDGRTGCAAMFNT